MSARRERGCTCRRVARIAIFPAPPTHAWLTHAVVLCTPGEHEKAKAVLVHSVQLAPEAATPTPTPQRYNRNTNQKTNKITGELRDVHVLGAIDDWRRRGNEEHED